MSSRAPGVSLRRHACHRHSRHSSGMRPYVITRHGFEDTGKDTRTRSMPGCVRRACRRPSTRATVDRGVTDSPRTPAALQVLPAQHGWPTAPHATQLLPLQTCLVVLQTYRCCPCCTGFRSCIAFPLGCDVAAARPASSCSTSGPCLTDPRRDKDPAESGPGEFADHSSSGQARGQGARDLVETVPDPFGVPPALDDGTRTPGRPPWPRRGIRRAALHSGGKLLRLRHLQHSSTDPNVKGDFATCATSEQERRWGLLVTPKGVSGDVMRTGDVMEMSAPRTQFTRAVKHNTPLITLRCTSDEEGWEVAA